MIKQLEAAEKELLEKYAQGTNINDQTENTPVKARSHQIVNTPPVKNKSSKKTPTEDKTPDSMKKSPKVTPCIESSRISKNNIRNSNPEVKKNKPKPWMMKKKTPAVPKTPEVGNSLGKLQEDVRKRSEEENKAQKTPKQAKKSTGRQLPREETPEVPPETPAMRKNANKTPEVKKIAKKVQRSGTKQSRTPQKKFTIGKSTGKEEILGGKVQEARRKLEENLKKEKRESLLEEVRKPLIGMPNPERKIAEAGRWETPEDGTGQMVTPGVAPNQQETPGVGTDRMMPTKEGPDQMMTPEIGPNQMGTPVCRIATPGRQKGTPGYQKILQIPINSFLIPQTPEERRKAMQRQPKLCKTLNPDMSASPKLKPSMRNSRKSKEQCKILQQQPGMLSKILQYFENHQEGPGARETP